jgi:integrase
MQPVVIPIKKYFEYVMRGMIMAVFVDINDNKLMIRFDYSPSRVEKIRKLKYIKWDRDRRAWLMPYTEQNLDRIVKLFSFEAVTIGFENRNEDDDVLRVMKDKLKLRGFSFRTCKAYIRHIRSFLRYAGKDLSNIDCMDVRGYIIFLMDRSGSSNAFINEAISALRFLLSHVLERGSLVEGLPCFRKEKELPGVLGREEVLRILRSIADDKHRTILFMVYSAGLKVSEAVRLKVRDIDSLRMLIRVSQAGVVNERYAMLSFSSNFFVRIRKRFPRRAARLQAKSLKAFLSYNWMVFKCIVEIPCSSRIADRMAS